MQTSDFEVIFCCPFILIYFANQLLTWNGGKYSIGTLEKEEGIQEGMSGFSLFSCIIYALHNCRCLS